MTGRRRPLCVLPKCLALLALAYATAGIHAAHPLLHAPHCDASGGENRLARVSPVVTKGGEHAAHICDRACPICLFLAHFAARLPEAVCRLIPPGCSDRLRAAALGTVPRLVAVGAASPRAPPFLAM
jgi:hypothetical protein